VHRDVKPGNLLVADTAVVKLADFGIARATDQSSITQVGSVLGTAAYLAPEQARGEEAGPRADIYSLGVVTYQLLSGRLPYEANSLSELAIKQQREAPTPLNDLNPYVRPELAQAVFLALALDQEARPPDAIQFADALRNGYHGLGPSHPTAPTAHLGTRAATRVLPRNSRQDGRAAGAGTAATRLAERGPDGRAARAKAAEPRTGRARTPDQRAGRTPTERPGRAPERAGQAPERAGQAPERAARAPDQRRQRQPAPAPPPAGAARRRSSGRAIRWIIGLSALCLIFLIAVVVAVVIAGSTSSGVVHFRSVVAHDAQSAINTIRQIIQKYTK
jgi:eukaryotic-like serine/threonine-protein kinase